MEHSGPRGYEVPRSSTLLSSSEAVARATAVENGTQQGEIYYNMGCHDDETLCNSTATPTYGNMAEHEYQEADFTSKSIHPVLKVSVLTIGHPCVDTVTQPSCSPHVMQYIPLVLLVLSGLSWLHSVSLFSGHTK